MPDTNLWRSKVSGKLIRVPTGLQYGDDGLPVTTEYGGCLVRGKSVLHPPWVGDATAMNAWDLGVQPFDQSYAEYHDQDVSGSLWVPKYLTIENLDNLISCGSSEGDDAVTDLNGAADILLTQSEQSSPINWNAWVGAHNGWTVVAYGLKPVDDFWIEIIKDYGGTYYSAYSYAHWTELDVRNVAGTALANIQVIGQCGDPAGGPGGATIACHGGELDLLLGDQT